MNIIKKLSLLLLAITLGAAPIAAQTSSGAGVTFAQQTSGALLFGSGGLPYATSAPTRLFWDTINFKLGINTNSPLAELDVRGAVSAINTFANFRALQTTTGTGYQWSLNNDSTFILGYTTDAFATVNTTRMLVTSSNVGVTGAFTASTTISAGTSVNAAAANGYLLGGVSAVSRDTNYTRLKDDATNNGITIGNATDPYNYYANTTHAFLNRAQNVTFATLNASTLTLSVPLNYGGVTLSNSVTGTGSMVLSTSPTLTGTSGGTALLVAAGTKGMRVVPTSATGTAIEGVDNTGAGSYQPLTIGGSALAFSASGTVAIDMNASGAFYPHTDAAANQSLGVSGARWNGIYVSLANTATTSAVCYNTGTGAITYNGTVGTCTVSALAYKVPGQPIANGKALASLVTMRTDDWTYKKLSGLDDREHVGLYADDVAKLDKRCAIYKDGKIENYDDRCVLAYTIAAMKELKAGSDNLKTEIEQLKKKVK